MKTGDDIIHLRVGGIQWEILAGMEDDLINLLEELDRASGKSQSVELKRDPSGSRIMKIKTNRPRLPAEIFVKIYNSRKLTRFLGPRFMASPARREWEMGFEHRRRGIPTARHLAWGVKKIGGTFREEYLIQESLIGYRSLPEFFRTTLLPAIPGGGPGEKRRLIRDLAQLLRRMHDQGISRIHIQPSNIMASSSSGGGTSFVFVDLHLSRVRPHGDPPAPEQRIRELAGFHQSFSPLMSQSYRIRFYRDYFAVENLDAARFQMAVKKIVTLAAELSGREERRIVRAVKRRSDPYFWFDTGGARIFLRKPLYQNQLIEVADKLRAGERPERVRIKLLAAETPAELMVVRTDDIPGASAERGFTLSAVLQYYGVEHFPAMAAVEGNGLGVVFYSVPGRGDYNLAEYLARRVAEEFSGLNWDRKFLFRVARFVFALHQLGYYFPNASGEDIWVRTAEGRTHQIMMLNLHKLRKLPPGAKVNRVRSIFELWKVLPISQADGLLLIEEYLRHAAGPEERRTWLRAFMEWQINELSGKQDAGKFDLERTRS